MKAEGEDSLAYKVGGGDSAAHREIPQLGRGVVGYLRTKGQSSI